MAFRETVNGNQKPTVASLARWPWGLPFFMLLLLLLASPNFRWQADEADGPRKTAYGSDFLQDWIGGEIACSGQREKLYDLAHSHRLQHDAELLGFEWPEDDYYPVVYPPFHYVLAAPFSRLPYRVAVIVAAFLSTLAFAVSGWLLAIYLCSRRRETSATDGNLSVVMDVARLPREPKGNSGEPQDTGNSGESHYMENSAAESSDPEFSRIQLPLSFPALMIGMCLFLPWIGCLSMGQKSTLLLLLFTGTFLLLRAGKNFGAGMLFGLVAIKPQLGLVIGLAMILKCQWSFVAGAGLVVGALAGVSYLIQPSWWIDYLQVVAEMGHYSETPGYLLHDSHSLWGGLKFSLPWLSSRGVQVIGGVLSAIILASVWWGLRDVGNSSRAAGESGSGIRQDFSSSVFERAGRFDFQFAILVLATLLISPHLFGYDLTLALLPLVLIVSQVGFRPRENSQRWLLGLAIAFYVLAGSFAKIALVTGVQVSWMLMLAMLLVLVFQSRSRIPQ